MSASVLFATTLHRKLISEIDSDSFLVVDREDLLVGVVGDVVGDRGDRAVQKLRHTEIPHQEKDTNLAHQQKQTDADHQRNDVSIDHQQVRRDVHVGHQRSGASAANVDTPVPNHSAEVQRSSPPKPATDHADRDQPQRPPTNNSHHGEASPAKEDDGTDDEDTNFMEVSADGSSMVLKHHISIPDAIDPEGSPEPALHSTQHSPDAAKGGNAGNDIVNGITNSSSDGDITGSSTGGGATNGSSGVDDRSGNDRSGGALGSEYHYDRVHSGDKIHHDSGDAAAGSHLQTETFGESSNAESSNANAESSSRDDHTGCAWRRWLAGFAVV
jgi:hypothetical protein